MSDSNKGDNETPLKKQFSTASTRIICSHIGLRIYFHRSDKSIYLRLSNTYNKIVKIELHFYAGSGVEKS